MSKKDEALKLALEALMEATKIHASSCKCSVCRAVIITREALAEQPAQQQQQEPVAYRNRLKSGNYTYCNTAQFFDNAEPLYTSPPAQPQQEPVAVKQIAEALRKHGLTLVKTAHSYHVMDLGRIEAQTTSPPAQRKPWVSLTDEEVKHEWVVWRASIPRYMGFAKGIEAKLREKNA